MDMQHVPATESNVEPVWDNDHAEFFVIVKREKQDGSIAQHCRLAACPNEQSTYYESGYFSKKYDLCLQNS